MKIGKSPDGLLPHSRPRYSNPFHEENGPDWGCRIADMRATALFHGEIFRCETGRWPSLASGPIRTIQGTPSWRSLDAAMQRQSYRANRLHEAFHGYRTKTAGVCSVTGKPYARGDLVYDRGWRGPAHYPHGVTSSGPTSAEVLAKVQAAVSPFGLVAYTDTTSVVYVSRPQREGCRLTALWWPASGHTVFAGYYNNYGADYGPLCANVVELAAWLEAKPASCLKTMSTLQ